MALSIIDPWILCTVTAHDNITGNILHSISPKLNLAGNWTASGLIVCILSFELISDYHDYLQSIIISFKMCNHFFAALLETVCVLGVVLFEIRSTWFPFGVRVDFRLSQPSEKYHNIIWSISNFKNVEFYSTNIAYTIQFS